MIICHLPPCVGTEPDDTVGCDVIMIFCFGATTLLAVGVPAVDAWEYPDNPVGWVMTIFCVLAWLKLYGCDWATVEGKRKKHKMKLGFIYFSFINIH